MPVQYVPHAPRPEGSAAPGTATRRDFLYLATATTTAIGVISLAWPFIDQMDPSADVIAAGGPLTVDLSKMQAGQQIVVTWRGRPIFIVRRTPESLTTLKSPELLARLRDPQSQSHQQPPYAANWSRSAKPEYAVLVGICTHLGCVPSFRPTVTADWPGGYLCQCHGSKYDLAGRVYRGVPAPLNLPVPPYRFDNDATLVIGENPQGTEYALEDVEQL
ncbi:MAG TPA: ubiquinol-cytochrome c reductase iron-sulfur subunit [Hypericibacter adhaerens]|jgi:ubiquinol-cytochrome c reductase iron-sulfur subunit|nr:ubiquinol-cytochrome c reductase iron-sulfur subunit [Hypericibacter adhaerens]